MTLEAQLYVIVRGKDSPLDIPLTEDGGLVPSDGITRCDLVFRREGVADVTISSASPVQSTWFSLQEPVEIEGRELTIVRVNLRSIPTPPTDGRYRVDVYLYDVDFLAGRYWGTIDIEIRPAPPAIM